MDIEIGEDDIVGELSSTDSGEADSQSRSIVTDSTSISSASEVYATSERPDRVITQRGDGADDIDPRNLHNTPDINEVRHYYNRTFAKVLVDKPVDDAFKNGFEIADDLSIPKRRRINRLLHGDQNDATNKKNTVNYCDVFQLADKKARRDGWSVIFYGLRDNTSGLGASPMEEGAGVHEITHLKVLTIDDFAPGDPIQVAKQTEYDADELQVRKSGIVVVKDPYDKNYNEPIGYCLNDSKNTFVHRDRCQHRVWNPEVDGSFRSDTLGEYEGDSVLISSFDLLKGMSKGNWAIMQALFRNASQMYSVTLPEDATDEDFEEANSELKNLNAMSELVLPFGYEVIAHDAEGNMEPREHYDVVWDQICACHEMTKSVLFGTQMGTVSGSEVDIKNYFNKVSRYQTEEAQPAIEQFLKDVNSFSWSSRSKNPAEGMGEVDIRWNPLFKTGESEKMEMFRTQANALVMLVEGYVMTPDEAREILSEEWADVDLSNLTKAQRKMLDEVLQTGEEAQQDAMGNPREGNASENGGGMSSGQKTSELADREVTFDDITIDPLV